MHSKSVSAILLEQFGLHAVPGSKVQCPYCHHETLSIRRDDTLAKCFHPGCGRFLHLFSRSEGAVKQNRLSDVLEAMFRAFHANLLSQKEHARSAYKYCVEERLIHPQVLVDSMIGSVPAGYDLNAAFAPAIEEVMCGNESSSVDRGHLDLLIKAREKLGYLSSIAGHLAFFYTDAYHRIVAIRFRQPYAKQIYYFKPTEAAGAFNHGLFRPCVGEEYQHLNDFLLVTEGEFNQLQLQSLFARHAVATGLPPQSGYLSACAVGGALNVDLQTVPRLAAKLVVCYDNDASGAGAKLVERLQQVKTVRAFTVPGQDTDLDAYIRNFGDDHKGAIATVRALVETSELRPRQYDAIRSEIDVLRRQEGSGKNRMKGFEVSRGVAEKILDDLEERGKLYHDNASAYLFLEAERQLIQVAPGELRLELLLSNYGVMPSEKLYEHVVNAIRLDAFEHGSTTEVYRFSHYDRNQNVLYVYNFGQEVYRISMKSVDTVLNGTDGVLFLTNPGCKPFSLVDIDEGQSFLMKKIIDPIRFREDGLTIEDRKLLFLVWIYSMFFVELFPTRPILVMLGAKGSGKSFALKRLGRLLFGDSFDVMPLSADSKDFDAAITNEAFVAVDNSDTKSPWLEDRLAVAATGGSIKRRELYTTNQLKAFKIVAYIGITSRTPPFRREDVAERLLIMHMDRIEQYTSESELLHDLQEHRDLIMSEIVGHLQEVVQALQEQKDSKYQSGFRMADFAEFALKIAHAQGWGDQMSSILDRLSGEQTAFVSEGEVVLELIDMWLEVKGNLNRQVATAELCSQLADIANRHNREFPFAGKQQAFGQHLSNLMGTLRERYGAIERTGSARKRYITFANPPKTEPGALFEVAEATVS